MGALNHSILLISKVTAPCRDFSIKIENENIDKY